MLRANALKTLRIAPAALLLALASCQTPKPPAPPPPPPPPPRVLPPHIGGPAALTCEAPEQTLQPGATAQATMKVSNEGGYCALRVAATDGKAFDTYTLPLDSLPAHGTAKITEYDGKTSIEYTPSVSYTGTDGFTAKLILAGKPGYTTVHLAITVTPRPAPAPAGK